MRVSYFTNSVLPPTHQGSGQKGEVRNLSSLPSVPGRTQIFPGKPSHTPFLISEAPPTSSRLIRSGRESGVVTFSLSQSP